jgi:hypothetical protein
VVIELHHRLWERDGRLDHALPAGAEDEVRARAVHEGDGFIYPAPEDMLAHLIVHGLYSHRLDCGPLLLSDLALLIAARPIDWDRFWTRARSQGWRDGARLVLDLVAWYRPETVLVLEGEPTPATLFAALPDLLLQELDTRRSAGFAAAALRRGPRRISQRLRGVKAAEGEAPVQREMDSEGGLLGWMAGRTARTLRDLSRADVRRQSKRLADLSAWLDR